MVRKIIDIVNVHVNPNRRKMNTGPVSRRRFVMKYKGMLKAIADSILLGRSQIMDDIASEKGW